MINSPPPISPKIVLASTSFWRKELTGWLGLPFEVIAPDFDEQVVPYSQFDNPTNYAQFLASGKAMSIQPQIDRVIVGADTVVFFDQQVFGKPKNLDEARQMLKELRGQTHQVFTGICIIQGEKIRNSVVESTVRIDDVSDDQLDKYIDTSESLNKAGSYSISGIAKSFVHLKSGSLTNVLGLSLVELAYMLEDFGIKVPVNIEKIIYQHLGAKS